jgi:hypothetical protein
MPKGRLNTSGNHTPSGSKLCTEHNRSKLTLLHTVLVLSGFQAREIPSSLQGRVGNKFTINLSD